MHGRLAPGAFVGIHTHDAGGEIIYIPAGTGSD